MTNEEAKEILKRVEIAKPIKFEDYADMREALNMAIKALEQQQYIHDTCKKCVEFSEFIQTGWIPTSERQPEENGNYLAFYHSGDETATLEFMMVDHCNAGGGWLHEKSGKKSYTKVIAWQPLPEPYKESEG